MTFEQKILFIFFLWFFFAFANMLALYTIDKQYKRKYCLTNVYKLDKMRFIFIYYARKKGEIAKYVFWLNIAFYVLGFIFISLLISYAVGQTKSLQVLSASFATSQFGLSILSASFNVHYEKMSGKNVKSTKN